uniref:Uncharacterized protein n=1 Tax=Tanacetum cinerariifolium TaxID=118510 RepID=A0A6L2M0T4_TANCI|nr:hypothetical protein [Tanacetum cinerariifolium]
MEAETKIKTGVVRNKVKKVNATESLEHKKQKAEKGHIRAELRPQKAAEQKEKEFIVTFNLFFVITVPTRRMDEMIHGQRGWRDLSAFEDQK